MKRIYILTQVNAEMEIVSMETATSFDDAKNRMAEAYEDEIASLKDEGYELDDIDADILNDTAWAKTGDHEGYRWEITMVEVE